MKKTNISLVIVAMALMSMALVTPVMANKGKGGKGGQEFYEATLSFYEGDLTTDVSGLDAGVWESTRKDTHILVRANYYRGHVDTPPTLYFSEDIELIGELAEWHIGYDFQITLYADEITFGFWWAEDPNSLEAYPRYKLVGSGTYSPLNRYDYQVTDMDATIIKTTDAKKKNDKYVELWQGSITFSFSIAK
jgi:hypothetical protein